MLIKQDSNIAILDVDRKTPLHLAASCQDSQAVDCVRLILVGLGVGWAGGGGGVAAYDDHDENDLIVIIYPMETLVITKFVMV